jgi:dienelactone hydrolase
MLNSVMPKYFRMLLLLAIVVSGSSAFGQEVARSKEVIEFIPTLADSLVKLETTIFSNDPSDSIRADSTRGPVIIINHGTTPARTDLRYRAEDPVKFFLSLGCVVVIPMRCGYSNSGGKLVDVRDCDLTEYALENADDIESVVTWVREQSDLKNRKIVLIGQSTGGLATMAYSSLTEQRVDAIINMHGGMRPTTPDACVLDAWIKAFATFAKTSSPESLWLYTANDHSSNPKFISWLYGSFVNAGGKAELHQLPAFKHDGHGLFGDPDGRAIWEPIVMNYLNRMGIFPK